MCGFVHEDELNQKKIIDKIASSNYGDEDFDLFKCPTCQHIYLIDYEGFGIFTNPFDLSKVLNGYQFKCVTCGYHFVEDQPIIGPKANDKFRVSHFELRKSDWNWVLSD